MAKERGVHRKKKLCKEIKSWKLIVGERLQ
jgi:hypothetical protein